MARKLHTRIVLQDENSLLYFCGPNQWTSDLNEAADFGEIRLAHEYCRSLEDAHLFIVVIFGNDRSLDVRLRVSPYP